MLVLYIDSAPIHIIAIIKETMTSLGCFYIYNAPYSAENNPIERIFGVWKMEDEKELFSFKTFEDILRRLFNYFLEIGNRIVSDTIPSV